MSYETVQLTVQDSVAELTLNRPERLNAWNDQLGRELNKAVLEDCADPSVRSVLITGRRAWVLLRSRRQGDAGARLVR